MGGMTGADGVPPSHHEEPMALKTTLEQLTEVQNAISAVMTGQSYRIGNRELTRADLSALEKREQTLLNRYRMEQSANGSGGTFNKVTFARPV